MKNNAILLLGVLLMGAGNPALGKEHRRPDEASLGRISLVRMVRLAQPRQRAACLLLQKKQPDQALPLFQQDARQHPDDLLDYVALTQIDAGLRQKEIARLTPRFESKTLRGEDTFKLGWCLLYDAWYKAMAGSGDWREELKRGYALREEAWQKEIGNQAASLEAGPSAVSPEDKGMRRLIIGLALADAYVKVAARDQANALSGKLVAIAAGPEAARLWQGAAKHGWKGQTPAYLARTWPEAQRCALVGVIGERWSLLEVQSVYPEHKDRAGTLVPKRVERLPEDLRSEVPYLRAWYKALQATLPPEIR